MPFSLQPYRDLFSGADTENPDYSGSFTSRYMKNPFGYPDSGMDDNSGGFNTNFLNRMKSDYFTHPTPDTVNIGNDNPSYLDYSPSTMLRKYLDYVQQAPQRDDYKPSKWGTALATISGALEGYRHGPGAGIKAATDIRDDPYNEAMGDYSTQLENMRKALTSEQQEQQMKGLFGYRQGQLENRADTNQIARDRNAITAENYQNRYTLGKQRADTAAQKEQAWEEQGIDTIRRLDAGEKLREKIDPMNAESARMRAEAAQASAKAAQEQAAAATSRAKVNAEHPPGTNRAPATVDVLGQQKKAQELAEHKFFAENDPYFQKFKGKVDPDKLSPQDRENYKAMQREIAKNYRYYLGLVGTPSSVPPPPSAPRSNTSGVVSGDF